MRPRRLELLNVGPFVGLTEIDFDRLGDIFLISGKTGSGKTTVFDSICYALYGNLPGGRRNQSRRLRSDFAPENAGCSVALEFDLGDKTYRVEREPPRNRKKARGEGVVEDPETATLYERTSAGLVAVSGKKADADERIKALMGLSFDEFSKIVLLPQGEFAEFLKQGTADRREVLKKLFPVDHAVRTKELASERSKAATARLVEAERALGEAASRFSPDEYDEGKQRARERLAAAEERARSLEMERERLAGMLRAAEAAEEIRRRLEQARAAETELDERSQEMERASARLAASRAAGPLSPLLSRKEAALAAAARSAEAAAAARNEREAKRSVLADAEYRNAQADGFEREAAGLREKRGPLADAARDEAELNSLAEEAARLREREAALLRRRKEAEQAAAARAGEIERLRATAEKADALDAAWEAARDAMEKARTLRPLSERASRLRTEREEAETARLAAAAEIDERKTAEPLLRAELEELEAQLRRSELAGSAAALAAELRPGTPCPVCGGLDHPAPAAAPSAAFDLSARRDVRRRSLEDATKALAEKTAQLRALEDRIARLDAESASLEAEAAQYAPALPTPEEASEELAARSAETTAAAGPRMEARKARDRLTLVYREVERDAEAARKLDAELAELAARRAAADAAAGEKEKRRAAALETFGAEAGAAAALETLDARIGELVRNAAVLRKERERAGEAAAAAASALEAAEKAAAAAELEANAAEERFSKALEGSPFRDGEALRKAQLDRDEAERLEREIPAWRDERNQAKTRREELEKEAEKAARSAGKNPDPDSVRAALEATALEREAAAAERDEALALGHALERDRTAYLQAAERRRMLAEEQRLLKAVADDLGGNNPKKRSFDAWLLGAYLSEVAAFATKRLERMSEGRYRLLLDWEREGGRGQTGLDLAVFDAYTGRTRPCATLSGGESFMASISLALGLADSIQSRSGGVRLDAVFIDEGFGSLDDASLDKALSILDEIRDHRMVGLISHVGEMRNRIPSRLEILKTAGGSRIASN